MQPSKPSNRTITQLHVGFLFFILSLGFSAISHAQQQSTYKFRPATMASMPAEEPVGQNTISVIKFKITQQNGRPFTDIFSLVLYNNKKRVIYYKEGDASGYVEFKITEPYTDQILNFYLLDKYGNEQYVHLHLDDFSETPEATLYKADANSMGLLIKTQLESPNQKGLKYMHGNGNWKTRR